jgi:HlyD family secretion protein
MRKLLILAVIFALAAATAVYFMRNNEKTPPYKTSKILSGDIAEIVTASGAIDAVTTVLVGTQVSGTIKSIHADFNSPVKKGQLIALIDPAVFEAQAEQAAANLLSAKADLQRAEVALKDAERTLVRNRQLREKDYIAQTDLDTAETNRDAAVAQAASARARVAQTAAALKMARTNLAYTRIVSPVDGTVVSRNVDVGQTVAASFQTPTLFTIAEDLKRMQISASVAEADVGRVAASMPVEFNVDAYPETIFKSAVSEIRNAPVTVQNVVSYNVIMKVENPELKLKPGMTANVSIIIRKKSDVLKVTNAALRFKPPTEGKKPGAKDIGAKDAGAGDFVAKSEKNGRGDKVGRGDKGERGDKVERGDKGGNDEKGGRCDKPLSGRTGDKSVQSETGGRPKNPAATGPGVWVLDGGKLRRVPVTTGISDGSLTEITSGELSEGREVVVESTSAGGEKGKPPQMRGFF